jgi:hypothetical protein
LPWSRAKWRFCFIGPISPAMLTLIITLPNGREFVAHAPREELKDIADEAFDK